MDNSSNIETPFVTSHPALAHMGAMDLVGNHRTSHGNGGFFSGHRSFVLSTDLYFHKFVFSISTILL